VSISPTPDDDDRAAQRGRDFITQLWGIACDDHLCVKCGCGRSIVPQEEDDRDDYDLIA
jgi:hypothetical protein